VFDPHWAGFAVIPVTITGDYLGTLTI